MLSKEIEDKKEEILKYEAVLKRYSSGRWMDLGLRHLEELRMELLILEDKTPLMESYSFKYDKTSG